MERTTAPSQPESEAGEPDRKPSPPGERKAGQPPTGSVGENLRRERDGSDLPRERIATQDRRTYESDSIDRRTPERTDTPGSGNVGTVE